MIVRLFCPFIYSLIMGSVWGAWFKKKFYSSLAIAFMTHILLVLLSGLIFKRLSFGVYGGIIITVIFGLAFVIKNKSCLSIQRIKQYIVTNWNDGVFVFATFYIFCFVINYGKRFLSWDEFSHWGMYLKESLRLDSLYCMSPLTFSHKDYVPAVTLFEIIWCQISGRFAESDAYRAIQIFMFSMLMPMLEGISDYTKGKISKDSNALLRIKYRLMQLVGVSIVLLIPLLFNTNNSFYFYHSIYCDVAVGIVFFWCVFEAYKDYDSISYHFVVLTIGITILVLSKMTAMALLPLVLVFFIAKLLISSRASIKRYHWILTLPLVGFPVVLWFWFNRFVDKYVENTGGTQSYDGMKLSSLLEVFSSPEKSAIPYLKTVKEVYIDAIIHKDILIHGSYLATMIAIVIALFIIVKFCDDNDKRKKAALVGFWTIGSGIFYALLMYFLYCTAFIEYEAVRLASYERYMNSFVIAAVFLLVAVYFDSNIWKKHLNSFYLIFALLFFDMLFFHVSAFDQILPGTIMHDSETISVYTSKAEIIINNTNEDEKIYIVKRGDNGDFIFHQKYYCNPRTIVGGSVGPALFDGDIWSSDKSIEEFIDSVKGSDYIYFCVLDDAFRLKYSEAFANPELLVDGAFYKITRIDTKIYLEQV